MRKTILQFAALTLAFAGQAASAQTQIKIATLAPQNSGWATEFGDGAEEIARRTDNRVRMKFFWGGAQGAESKVLQKIKIGQLHGGTFSPTDFQDQYADLNIYGLPFLFRSPEEIDYVRERVDQTLESGLAERGFKTYGFAGGGFAYILSNDPVRGLDDLRGKKVWLPEGDEISFEAMKSLDLSPVPLPVTDVLTGLQTGLIDIVAIPPAVALALQWHTKVSYVTRIPVLYPMGFLAISERALRRVSDADRAVIDEVMSGVYSRVDENSWAENSNAVDALLSVGIQEVEPRPGEVAELRATMVETSRDMARRGMFSEELYDEIRGYVADYRRSRDTEEGAEPRSSGTR